MSKKQISILILIIVIIILITIVLLKMLDSTTDDNELKNQEESYLYGVNNPGTIIDGVIPSKTKIPNIYFSIEKALFQYLEYVKNQEQVKIYGLLDYKYINENNINVNNVMNYVTKYNPNDKAEIQEMYEISGSKYSSYYINYRVEEASNYIIINVDISSDAFSVINITKEQYEKLISEPAKAYGSNEDTVSKNKYNEFSFTSIDIAELVEKYFYDFKQKNNDKVGNLVQYSVSTTENNVTEYICTDTKQKTYVFTINAVMDYTVREQ